MRKTEVNPVNIWDWVSDEGTGWYIESFCERTYPTGVQLTLTAEKLRDHTLRANLW